MAGVGKTSLTYLIAKNEALTSPGWTVGSAVEVKLHEYKEGTPHQHTYFIELWDIGGSISHKNTRGVFYNPVHGIILVHDLTNRKSHENLQKWIVEILNKDGKDASKGSSSSDTDFDPEQFLGSTQVLSSLSDLVTLTIHHFHYNKNMVSTKFENKFKNLQIPILVIGTKSDIVDDAQRIKQLQRTGNIGTL